MRRIALNILLVAGLFAVAIPSAIAADLSDTTWKVKGHSRMWSHQAGRAFERMNDVIQFQADPDGDGTARAEFSFDLSALNGPWADKGGRRFGGRIDDASFEQILEGFINSAAGVDDASVTQVRRDRIWGHLNKQGDVLKMKIRVKVWYTIPSQEIERQGAWVKIGLRGRLMDGTPGSGDHPGRRP